MSVSCVYKVCPPEFLLAHGENACHTLQGQICLPPPRSGQSCSIYRWRIRVSGYPTALCLVPSSPRFRFKFVWIDIKYQDWENVRFHAAWCDKAHIVCLLGRKTAAAAYGPVCSLNQRFQFLWKRLRLVSASPKTLFLCLRTGLF